MKWSVCLVLAAAAACQSGENQATPTGSTPTGSPTESNTTIIQLPKAQVTDEYRADINTLCDVVRLSGAADKPKDERWTVVAMYLGPQIKTTAGRDFLVAIQPLKGEAKALALETEAKRVGLEKCELANEWRESASAGSGS
jgi:hypothetical protein